MKKLLLFSFLTFVIGLSLGLFFMRSDAPQPGSAKQPYRDFTLYSQGEPVHLHDFDGKLVLLLFGYTSCPDVCPLTLNKLATLLRDLGEQYSKQVQVLFVSVDPQRDSADKLFQYTQYFHPSIIGLTGTKQQIDKVVKLYAADYKKVEAVGKKTGAAEAGYAIDHTASIYVIGKDGIWSGLLPSSASVAQWLETVKPLL